MAKEPDPSAWSSVAMRCHSKNIDTFLHVGILLDRQRAIGVNLMNEEWSCCSLLELTRSWNLDHDALASCAVKATAFDVLLSKIFINQNLTPVSDCL